jgi:hypothetical protein
MESWGSEGGDCGFDGCCEGLVDFVARLRLQLGVERKLLISVRRRQGGRRNISMMCVCLLYISALFRRHTHRVSEVLANAHPRGCIESSAN